MHTDHLAEAAGVTSIKHKRVATPWWRSLHCKVTTFQVLLLAAMIGATLAIMFTIERSLLVEKGRELQEQMGNRVVSELQNRVHLTESLTTSLANLGERLAPDESVYRQVVPHLLDYENRETFIAGGGIWPEAYQFDPAVERRSFFWGREPDGSLKYYDDYNDPTGEGYHHEEWYVPATYYQPGEAYWSKSYMDPYSYQPMVTCTVPMWREEGVTGVATVDIKLEGLHEFLNEASKELGGYMFVVDRNNKFLAFPAPAMVTHEYRDEKGNTASEFYEAEELAEADPRFAPIAEVLESLNAHMVENASGKHPEFERIADEIAQRSYQINPREARVMAAAMLEPVEFDTAQTMQVKRVYLDNLPLIDEPVMVSVFMMPKTHWKVVAVTPMSKLHASADAATWKVGSYIMGLELLGLLVMFLLIRKVVVRPLRSLSTQVREISEGEGQLSDRLDDSSPDELGQLAYEFNRRSDHLVHALDELQQARDDLEHRVAQRTAELAESEHRFRQMAETIRQVFWVVDAASQKVLYLSSAYEEVWGRPVQSVYDDPDSRFQVVCEQDRAQLEQAIAHAIVKGEGYNLHYRVTRPDGVIHHIHDRCFPIQNEAGEVYRLAGVAEDVTERVELELERKRLNQQLVEASRQAGMAEVATGVLHNVGNVLNSVNVSAATLEEGLRGNRCKNLQRTIEMMQAHDQDLARFLTEDEKGKQVLPYLANLARYFEERDRNLYEESESLITKVDHAKRVVSAQQATAKNQTLPEAINLADTIEDVLQMHADSIQQRGIKLVRNSAALPRFITDKHLVLQVLANLVNNAIKALRCGGQTQKQLTIRVTKTGEADSPVARIEVIDNGIGIDPERLSEVFTFGYTKWDGSDGSGFGLHNAANTAKVLGGTLTAESGGPGTGARFIFELPMTQQTEGIAA